MDEIYVIVCICELEDGGACEQLEEDDGFFFDKAKAEQRIAEKNDGYEYEVKALHQQD
jgi:hypothetical protein